MRVIILNAEKLKERAAAHEYLKKLFGFPDYYGKNLDALYDCLTDIQRPTTVIMTQSQSGGYAERIAQVIEEAAEKGRIKFIRAGKEAKQ